MRALFLRGTLMWLAMAVTAFVLGALREGLLTPRIGAFPAHVLGTVALCVVDFTLIIVFVARFRRAWTPRELWLIGTYWLVLALAFEFLFFHYVAGESWEALLANYNVLMGRLWPLVPVTVLVGPRLALILLNRRSHAGG